MSSRTLRSPLATFITVLGMLFLVGPLIVVVLFSFQSTASLSLPFEGFSLRWYETIFDDPNFRDAGILSLKIAAIVSLLMATFGTLAAYGLSLLPPRISALCSAALFLPILLPLLFVGLALRTWFVRTGAEFSMTTIVIGHAIYVLPYFLLIMKTVLDRLDPYLAEAAAALGASPRQVFLRVVLPQIRPILVAAVAIVFALSMDEFPITFWVAGAEQTIPVLIYSKTKSAIDPSINATASLLMLTTLIGVTIGFLAYMRSERIQRGSATPTETEGSA